MTTEPDQVSLRNAMDEAWRDHQHTRDQTWKALHVQLMLAVGIVTANWQLQSLETTWLAIVFALVISLCAIQITFRHRNKVELRKFDHIMNCEEALHLRSVITGVERPKAIRLVDVFNPRKGNTALFILRMNFAIMGFTLLLLVMKLRGLSNVPNN